MRVADFDYDLPDESIAQTAIEPRDASRLLVARTLEDRHFSDLPELLQRGDVLVVNRTRVRAARVQGTKTASGGRVELLLLRRLDVERWEALIRPARRIRAGTQLEVGAIAGEVLSDPVRGLVTVALHAPGGDVDDLLPAIGTMPLPPYFHGELADPERYQTVFAKALGSAAAPTAALHFTSRLLEAIADAGIVIAEVELDVGLDTFRPMDAELVAEHHMHRERYCVPEETVDAIAAARARNGRVVAVGTTVVRTLETASRGDQEVAAGEGESELFITPGYRFGVVDAMLTNFHAPRTTLIALVAAALGPDWRRAYEIAVRRGYRFLSFGDAMLIEGLRPS